MEVDNGLQHGIELVLFTVFKAFLFAIHLGNNQLELPLDLGKQQSVVGQCVAEEVRLAVGHDLFVDHAPVGLVFIGPEIPLGIGVGIGLGRIERAAVFIDVLHRTRLELLVLGIALL